MRKELYIVVGVLALIFCFQIVCSMDGKGGFWELFIFLCAVSILVLIALTVENFLWRAKKGNKATPFIEILWSSFMFGFLGTPAIFLFIDVPIAMLLGVDI